jgi:hypothetical protein
MAQPRSALQGVRVLNVPHVGAIFDAVQDAVEKAPNLRAANGIRLEHYPHFPRPSASRRTRAARRMARTSS